MESDHSCIASEIVSTATDWKLNNLEGCTDCLGREIEDWVKGGHKFRAEDLIKFTARSCEKTFEWWRVDLSRFGKQCLTCRWRATTKTGMPQIEENI